MKSFQINILHKSELQRWICKHARVVSFFCVLANFAAFQSSLHAQAPKTDVKKSAKVAASIADDKTSGFIKSRYITDELMPSYIEKISASMTSSKRYVDPFGQVQDPDAKPVVKTTIVKKAPIVPVQATPLIDIINLLKITTVIPSEQKFLIGSRVVKEGDRLPLTHQSRQLNVEVKSVSKGAIQFRDIDSGEAATLNLSLMPAGMRPGSSEITPSGMIPDGPNTPIRLD